jgi:hypothetical protein
MQTSKRERNEATFMKITADPCSKSALRQNLQKMTPKLKLETLKNPKAKLKPDTSKIHKSLNFSTKQLLMVLRWVAKIMKREKQKTHNSKPARERGGASMGADRWVLVASTPSTEKGNGFASRHSVDKKDK